MGIIATQFGSQEVILLRDVLVAVVVVAALSVCELAFLSIFFIFTYVVNLD